MFSWNKSSRTKTTNKISTSSTWNHRVVDCFHSSSLAFCARLHTPCHSLRTEEHWRCSSILPTQHERPHMHTRESEHLQALSTVAASLPVNNLSQTDDLSINWESGRLRGLKKSSKICCSYRYLQPRSLWLYPWLLTHGLEWGQQSQKAAFKNKILFVIKDRRKYSSDI